VKRAYYNEIDPYAAQWLRNLIEAGHIAPGDVDERSIEDVSPDDLRGYTQCHFFAGIGVWSYALRQAGWPDDRTAWTGSCPCQPFSTAGKRKGAADERHLWPAWFHLIEQCCPPVVFGEQVASPDGYAWLDLVWTDMEAAGYAFGPVVLPAAGFGAPHGRHRIYFVADANGARLEGRGGVRERTDQRAIGARCMAVWLADAESQRCGQGREDASRRDEGAGAQWVWGGSPDASGGCELDNTNGERRDRQQALLWAGKAGRDAGRVSETPWAGEPRAAHQTHGFWRDADWLLCRDGKWRPVEPGSFPLAHGATARVGRLRAYGNAIVAQVAEEFVRSFMTLAK
jgi:DNA (cytosine-5)-methyltransferase 1